jgi:DNA-binding GntR family transcriptional regulator
VVAYHRLSRIPANEDGSWDSPEQEQKHRDFHNALLSACDSNILLRYCEELQEQTLRYRKLSAVVKYREGREGIEHSSIKDAVLDRDADKAVALLKSHYEITAEIVIDSGSLDNSD